MENMMGYGVQQSLIDTVTFYLANAAITSKPKMDETLIFGASDLLVRNGWITWYKDSPGFSDNFGKNAYIGLASFAVTTLYDLIRSKDASAAIKDNLMKNAIGVGGNIVVDMVISKKYV